MPAKKVRRNIMNNPFDGVVAYQKIKLANMIFANTDIPIQTQTLSVNFDSNTGGLRGNISFAICNDPHYDQFSGVTDEAKIALIDYLIRDLEPQQDIRFKVWFSVLDGCLKVEKKGFGILVGIEKDGYTHS
jgi:hypothetical protein